MIGVDRRIAATEPGSCASPILFVFLDGLGLAPPGPGNPLSTVPMPRVRELLGGPLVPNGMRGDAFLSCSALDACLGVPGLPQSATGQTTLFTGMNAAALVGDHLSAYPTAPLRAVIAKHSLLKRAAEAGARVTMANAYSERYWAMVRNDRRGRNLSASTLTTMAAGGAFRTLEDLVAGRAVMWDLTNEIAVSHFDYDLPLVAPAEAGARLARLSAGYDLVFYESFLTDLAGHGRLDPAWVLIRLDAFFGGLLDARPPNTTLVVSSDHGNLEDTTTKLHTINPVPLLAVGPAAPHFGAVADLTGVTPAILAALECIHEPERAG